MSTLSLPINSISSIRALHQLLWLLVLPTLLHGQEENSEKRRSLSPDKQWEYRVIKESTVLVRAGSDEPALNLNEEIGYLAIETGKLVWAPGSRRFAFNSRAGGKSYVCELYELAGHDMEKTAGSVREREGGAPDNRPCLAQTIEEARRQARRQFKTW